MSALPIELEPSLAVRLEAAFDREGKIVRALEALGPVANRDVVGIGVDGGPIRRGIEALGARLATVGTPQAPFAALPVESGSADVVLSAWSSFRGVEKAGLREVDRVLRAGGRQLVVHDYGRDDISRLSGERPEAAAWSDRNGPFLTSGFRVRVIHCWWTFDALDDVRSFLADAFGTTGRAVGDALQRPRLSYKVAVYHRTRGDSSRAFRPAPTAC